MEHPVVSVVLPVFINKEKNFSDTMRCISLLRSKTKVPFKLVIVETCSNLFTDYADVHIYEKEKTDCNKSVNAGFGYCNSGYVVFIGNDVFVDDGWLESLLECFKIDDCGIATLGNSEHRDIKHNEIVEGIYFSICMLEKQDAWFDLNYRYIFDDTDLIFRVYLSGRKCYKNLNCIVTHAPHSTYGKFCGDPQEYERSRKYFIEKYKDYSDHPLYLKFAGL